MMKIRTIFSLAAILACLGGAAQAAILPNINANASDNHLTNSTVVAPGDVQDGGGAAGTNTDAIRIGSGGDGTQNLVGMFAFQLPTLNPGETFLSASYNFHLFTKDGTVSGFNADVYAVTTLRSTPTLVGGDFFIGAFGDDPTDAVALQDNFLTSSTPNGLRTASAAGELAFTNFLNTLYGGNTDPVGGAGQYLFLRLSPDSDPLNGNHRYRISQSSTANPPFLSLTTTAVPEPSTYAMLALGSSLVLFRRLRRRAALN